MRQRDALVARAIVAVEIATLAGDGGVVRQHGTPHTLTAKRIADAYGLEWGHYPHGDRAEQLIRKALHQAAADGGISVVGKERNWNVYARSRA